MHLTSTTSISGFCLIANHENLISDICKLGTAWWHSYRWHNFSPECVCVGVCVGGELIGGKATYGIIYHSSECVCEGLNW